MECWNNEVIQGTVDIVICGNTVFIHSKVKDDICLYSAPQLRCHLLQTTNQLISQSTRYFLLHTVSSIKYSISGIQSSLQQYHLPCLSKASRFNSVDINSARQINRIKINRVIPGISFFIKNSFYVFPDAVKYIYPDI